jgi:hypothetical protein
MSSLANKMAMLNLPHTNLTTLKNISLQQATVKRDVAELVVRPPM